MTLSLGATEAREYRLNREEDPAEAMVRVIDGRLANALEQLGERLGDDPEAAVHEARKDLKKARAAMRLLRDELGRERYRGENARMRGAARRLSGARDADVLAQTVAALRERYRIEFQPAVAGAVRAALERSSRNGGGAGADLDAVAREAATEIAAARRSLASWELESGEWTLISAGLGRAYRRGRVGLRQVRGEPTTEAVHEWRKRVKDLWYHLRLLSPTWPDLMRGNASHAHELSELLGDHHDLGVLTATVEDGRLFANRSGRAAGAVTALAERRQGELIERAIPLGERLYAEKPGAYVARLRSYWNAWRAE